MSCSSFGQRGQSLIEVLVAVFVVAVLVIGVTGVGLVTTRLLLESERHTVGLALINEKLEAVRSLSYLDVGTVGGDPAGPVEPTEVVMRNGQSYTIDVSITWVDDPLSPGAQDYKKVEARATWEVADGATRDASAVTFVTEIPVPTDCTCPIGWTCDPTTGLCLPPPPPTGSPTVSPTGSVPPPPPPPSGAPPTVVPTSSSVPSVPPPPPTSVPSPSVPAVSVPPSAAPDPPVVTSSAPVASSPAVVVPSPGSSPGVTPGPTALSVPSPPPVPSPLPTPSVPPPPSPPPAMSGSPGAGLPVPDPSFPPDPQPSGTPCSTDADCRPEEVCMAGVCTPDPLFPQPSGAPCTTDAQCGLFHICMAGSCAAQPCVEGDFCANGSICWSGICSATPCLNGFCPLGEQCWAGWCYPDQCFIDGIGSGVPFGPGLGSPGGQDNRDGSGGHDPMICQCQACQFTGECGGNEASQCGFFTNQGQAACGRMITTHSCETSTWSRYCQSYIDNNPCQARSSSCDDNDPTNDGDCLICNPIACTTGSCPNGNACSTGQNGPACNVDADCTGTRTCNGGECVWSCGANSDCPRGRMCSGGRCAQICGDKPECGGAWGGYGNACTSESQLFGGQGCEAVAGSCQVKAPCGDGLCDINPPHSETKLTCPEDCVPVP